MGSPLQTLPHEAPCHFVELCVTLTVGAIASGADWSSWGDWPSRLEGHA